ncbi:Cell division protein ZapE [Sodalis praecaptivus]
MQATSPLSLYQQMLAQGEYQPDDVQAAAIACLDRIHQQLGAAQHTAASAPSGLLRLLGKNGLARVSAQRTSRSRVYICGAE